MAQYPSVVVTDKGHDLISTSNATNKAVIYIKAVVGDGQLNNQSIESLTAMISPKLGLPLTSGLVKGNGEWRVSFALSNSTVTSGFYAREVGVFAKLSGEDDSTAILFAYTNGGNYVDYIPPKTTPIDSQVFNCDFVIGDAENVTVNILDGTFVTHQDFTNQLSYHNTDLTAHKDIRQMFNNYLPLTGGTVTGPIVGNVKGNADTATKATQDGSGNVITDMYLKKAGDTVTGMLNVPTQATTDNSTKVANTAFVQSAVNNILNTHNTNPNAHTPILNAIKAISGMSAYDIAPSQTIASMIPLLGFGGIVAQKLETNGYIKFANGLIIQWGSTIIHDRETLITFPIAFSTKCFCGLVTAQKSSDNLSGSQCNPAVRIAGTTGMVAIMYDNSNTGWYWLAIGI